MFRELNRRFKQTIILVTHNPELVTYTDRLIEMRDGVVVSDNDSSWDTDSELAQPARSV
jgi:putative ABC transport system ATP-binding protein